MQTNREVKVAIVVGIIMITVCLVLIITQKNKNNTVTLDLQVLKHIVTNAETGEGAYVECAISTEDLSRFNVEYKKIVSLNDKSKATRNYSTIRGDYKIQSGSNFIAFDTNNVDGLVYRSDTTGLYIYNSAIYSEIETLCENVNLNPIQPGADTKQEETETKNDTKKDTQKANTKKTTKQTKKK